MLLDHSELAWAAGFYDGEGCSCSFKTGIYPRFSLQIAQNEPTTLICFQKAVRGIGFVNGPHIRQNPNANPSWRYAVASFEGAQAIIGLLWKFLSEPKRNQAKKGLLTMKEYYRDR